MNNEQDLIANEYVLTPNIAQTGTGDGKVYEKIVSEVDGDTAVDRRTYYVVNPDGTIAPWLPNVGVVSTPVVAPVEAVPAPEATVAPETDIDTSEDTTAPVTADPETAPEAPME